MQSTRSLVLGIWSHLAARRRQQFAVFLIIILLSSLTELLTIGAILPFLSVISDPNWLWDQPMIRASANWMGLMQPNHLLLPATLIFATAAVLSALVRLGCVWFNGQFSAAVGSDLSSAAYLRTLYQPYCVHVQRHTSSVITTATTQTNVSIAALSAFLQLITASVTASFIFAGLMLIDWPVALTSLFLFSSAYALLAYSSRSEISLNGQKIAEASRQQLQSLQEGLGAIRDVLLDGSQPYYVSSYRSCDWLLRRLQARNQYLSSLPRFVLEAFAMVSISLLALLLVKHRSNPASVIPLLGVMALGAQRMLPALQQIYGTWATLRSSKSALSDVLDALNQPLPTELKPDFPLPFDHSLRLESAFFHYQAGQPDVLRDINLEIFPGERVGLIGSTGSGKSTLVDLMMGLLEPSCGRVLVDSHDIHDPSHPLRALSWRASIAHVPQSIFIADSSIAENIAFGIPSNQIDLARVRCAAEQAQIASFIESLDQGFHSSVGERGVRLSGGQRQRIGIARALYKQASILVFDEATSALDNVTEEAVMSSVELLSRKLTIIIIAHRLSTVECCDRIIRLDNGVVSADGPPLKVLYGA